MDYTISKMKNKTDQNEKGNGTMSFTNVDEKRATERAAQGQRWYEIVWAKQANEQHQAISMEAAIEYANETADLWGFTWKGIIDEDGEIVKNEVEK